MDALLPALLIATVAAGGVTCMALFAVGYGLGGRARPTEDRDGEDARWAVRARAALDAVPDWVILVRDGVVIDTNAPAHTTFDTASPQALGRTLDEVYPDSGGTLVDHLRRADESHRAVSFEYLWANGTRYAEARVYPLSDGLSLVVTRDTTEQKSKETVLHRSKERFALAVQGANDGLWDWDLETELVYFSYQWKAMVGYDPTEEANRAAHWFDRVHPDDIGAVRAALQAHLEGEAPRFESEHRIRGSDGSWLWVLTRGMAVRDARGGARRIAGSMTDLTNRRVVAVTQEKANLLQHATESVGIGVAVLTAKNRLTGTGDALRAMTSEWKDLDEWWHAVIVDHPAPDPVPCPTCDRPHHVGTVLAEVYRPRSDAYSLGNIELLSQVFEIAWAGHAHEIGAADSHVLLIKDVTDRVRAERRLFRANEELLVARDTALAASRAKSAFLANMSHELRTPLNHIIGYTEMVAEELEENGQQALADDLGRVRLSGAHLLDMITGILDLSRIEAGLSEMSLELFSVEQLIREVLVQWEPELSKRNNELELNVEPLGPMNANRPQVRRIVDALVSNACKFCEQGVVSVSAENGFRAGREWLTLTVRDTGVGMDADRVRSLFAGFAMGDESSTRTVGGAGLGLTLANRFAEMMGGAIDVSSKLGEGSTFRVTLPLDVRRMLAEEDALEGADQPTLT